ncbi:cytosine deaminase, partial [Thioclava sp. BHET1]
MDFRQLPEGPITLKNLHLPACFLDQPGDLLRIDLTIAQGRICAPRPDAAEIDMAGSMVLPVFTDMHTHLD